VGFDGVVGGSGGGVTPSETRHKYVPVGSSKTSLFCKVSEGVTPPPDSAAVCVPAVSRALRCFYGSALGVVQARPALTSQSH